MEASTSFPCSVHCCLMLLSSLSVEQRSCTWRRTLSVDNPQSKQTQSATICQTTRTIVHSSTLSQPLLNASALEWSSDIVSVMCGFYFVSHGWTIYLQLFWSAWSCHRQRCYNGRVSNIFLVIQHIWCALFVVFTFAVVVCALNLDILVAHCYQHTCESPLSPPKH